MELDLRRTHLTCLVGDEARGYGGKNGGWRLMKKEEKRKI
jgi:hypothetical protein